MTNTTDPTSAFLDANSRGGDYDGVSFHTMGDKVAGTVVETPREVDTQYGPRLVVAVQPTTLRQDGQDIADASEPRTVWIKPGAMATAVKKALSGNRLGVGDTFGIAFTGEGEAKPGLNPPKFYTAVHTPAAPSVNVDDVFGGAPAATGTDTF